MSISQEQRTAAANRIATLALSMFQIHGLPAPDNDELGTIVKRAEAAIDPHLLRHPESISAGALGQIDQFVLGAAEAKKRPVNIHSADAPSGGRAGADKSLPKSFDLLDRVRQLSSSTRYRDLPAGDGTGGSYVSERGMGNVPAEFMRAFAGAGVGRDTIKTFAAVGLDRGTFDQFRHEGFSTAQIADNAKDMKVLGGHGREDLTVGQHAPTDLRKASVEVEKEKDPAKKEQKRQREAQVAERYEALPDSDKRKKGARDFINWLENHHHHINREHGASTTAKLDDGALKTEQRPLGTSIARTQDAKAASFKKQDVAALTKNDDFGEAPDPAPKKPEPVKTAAAKPPAGPKPV